MSVSIEVHYVRIGRLIEKYEVKCKVATEEHGETE
jgi:hypothetical protein